MSTIRIEFIAGHQALSCENCNFGVLSVMGRHCPQCGAQFTRARFIGLDGSESVATIPTRSHSDADD